MAQTIPSKRTNLILKHEPIVGTALPLAGNRGLVDFVCKVVTPIGRLCTNSEKGARNQTHVGHCRKQGTSWPGHQCLGRHPCNTNHGYVAVPSFGMRMK